MAGIPELGGGLEAVNTSVDPIFANTSNNDLAIYTETTTQSIHLGTAIGAQNPSMMRINASNIEIQGDIFLTRRVGLNGVLMRPRAVADELQNITTRIFVPPVLSSSNSHVAFTLCNPQTEFRFQNSNAATLATITNMGQILAASNDTSNAPAYSWSNDLNTGMFHPSNDIIGFSCAGSNIMTMSNTGARVFGTLNATTLQQNNINVLTTAGGTLTGTITGGTVNATTLQQGGTSVSLTGHIHDAGAITTGTLSVARGGTGTTSSTGTGSVVLNNAPTFSGTVNMNTLSVSTQFYAPGSVVQMAYGTLNTSGSTNTAVYENTGLAVSIAPRFTSSRLLVVANIVIEISGGTAGITAPRAIALAQIRRDGVEDATANVGTTNSTGASQLWLGQATSVTFLSAGKIPLSSSYTANSTASTTFSVWVQCPTLNTTNHGTAQNVTYGATASGGRSEIIVYEIAQ